MLMIVDLFFICSLYPSTSATHPVGHSGIIFSDCPFICVYVYALRNRVEACCLLLVIMLFIRCFDAVACLVVTRR